ncbi:repressor LexA [bacterium endosymbiont of Escarpia laminata]|nr:MAG: repressor LexA [bacterium endosymbiont of Escarpia laminata]
MPTKQQTKVLNFVRGHIASHGRAPTLEEIGEHLGGRSRGAVHRLVQILIDEGFLARNSSGWRSLEAVDQANHCDLPMLGRIAAGSPIEAIEDQEVLSFSDLFGGPNRYALKVTGDSMVEAGILDGDSIIVEHADSAEDGEIIVALVDGVEVTLKRLKTRSDGQVELIAENSLIPPMVYDARRVKVQGVLIGQLRSYR